MGIAVVGVIVALAGIIATGVTYVGLSGRAKRAQQSLESVLAERQTLADKAAAGETEAAKLTAERDELQRTNATLLGERDDARAALDDERRQHEQADDAAGEPGGSLEASEPEAHREVPTEDPSATVATERAHPEADGCWALLLADLTRRWAAVVGAPPEMRGVHLGAVADQLTEALTREIDRLREEVGVDISFKAEAPVEPADPVVFLLAATHLLGEMAAGCQRVKVALDGALVLAGDEWSGPVDDLEEARERTLAAGARVDPLEVEEKVSEPEDAEAAGRPDEADDLSELAEPGPGRPDTPVFSVRLALHPEA